eukprot:TRINITY_DN8149_c0_g1_i2.p1 TRINITY_DN8149_c0_g1~~TRINITY_DN8149_c0_g1_i2.p1  ORF type:complete len:185 (-),score=14.50 TRINITY_DN8149_c0_g1_i2:165-719(-)
MTNICLDDSHATIRDVGAHFNLVAGALSTFGSILVTLFYLFRHRALLWNADQNIIILYKCFFGLIIFDFMVSVLTIISQFFMLYITEDYCVIFAELTISAVYGTFAWGIVIGVYLYKVVYTTKITKIQYTISNIIYFYFHFYLLFEQNYSFSPLCYGSNHTNHFLFFACKSRSFAKVYSFFSDF